MLRKLKSRPADKPRVCKLAVCNNPLTSRKHFCSEKCRKEYGKLKRIEYRDRYNQKHSDLVEQMAIRWNNNLMSKEVAFEECVKLKLPRKFYEPFFYNVLTQKQNGDVNANVQNHIPGNS